MKNDKPPVRAVAVSDAGRRRRHNEDSWSITKSDEFGTLDKRGWLFQVADGVGGAAAGEVASKITVSEMARGYFTESTDGVVGALRSAISGAHEKILQTAGENKDYQGMASTLTALVLMDSKAYIAQVGDSRAYLIRNRMIQQLTSDQTVTCNLLNRGEITIAEAEHHPQRHILLQALGGGGSPPQPKIDEIEICPGDRLLLCTDGLYNLVSDEEIKAITLEYDLQLAADSLIKLANDRGGTDNITAMLIYIDEIGFTGSIRKSILAFKNKFAAVFI